MSRTVFVIALLVAVGCDSAAVTDGGVDGEVADGGTVADASSTCELFTSCEPYSSSNSTSIETPMGTVSLARTSVQYVSFGDGAGYARYTEIVLEGTLAGAPVALTVRAEGTPASVGRYTGLTIFSYDAACGESQYTPPTAQLTITRDDAPVLDAGAPIDLEATLVIDGAGWNASVSIQVGQSCDFHYVNPL